MTSSQSRRDFVRALVAGSAAFPVLPGLLGCSTISAVVESGGSARLSARPRSPSTATGPGTYELTPGSINDAYLLVPPTYKPGTKMPFVLALHGAGGQAQGQINLLGPVARERGFFVLAVGSRDITWDAIRYRYGPDVSFIDGALKWAFDLVDADPARVACSGFSDGASYALGLTLANGDLFPKGIAFSPGFIPASDSPDVGKPKFFESHGRQDAVLPIGSASRRIVPALQQRGYAVQYREFDGGHQVPADVLAAAADFIMA